MIYDRHREKEREAETQEEGEAGSMLGARHGTGSQNSRIPPCAKGRRQTAEPPRDPLIIQSWKKQKKKIRELVWKSDLWFGISIGLKVGRFQLCYPLVELTLDKSQTL